MSPYQHVVGSQHPVVDTMVTFLTPSSVGTLFVLPTQHIFRQMSTRSEEDLIPEGYDSSGNRSLHHVSRPAFDKELVSFQV